MPKSHWKDQHLSEEHRQRISSSLVASNARRKALPKPDTEVETALISVRGVDLELWHRLRVRALEQHHTTGDALSEAIREWLDSALAR